MTRPRCGKVNSLGAPMPDGRRNITIDGAQYFTTFDPSYFPVRVGSLVEFKATKKRAEITGIQAELIPMPEAANLFNSGGLFNSSCTDCIGSAGSCLCLKGGE